MGYYSTPPSSDEIYHFGIQGQKWGIRRYQNADGSLTAAGKKRYNDRLTKHQNLWTKVDQHFLRFNYMQRDFHKRRSEKTEEKLKAMKNKPSTDANIKKYANLLAAQARQKDKTKYYQNLINLREHIGKTTSDRGLTAKWRNAFNRAYDGDPKALLWLMYNHQTVIPGIYTSQWKPFD